MSVTVVTANVVQVSTTVSVKVTVRGGPDEGTFNASVSVLAFYDPKRRRWELRQSPSVYPEGGIDQARYTAMCLTRDAGNRGEGADSISRQILEQIRDSVLAALPTGPATPAA